MDILPDDKTPRRLFAVAALQNTAVQEQAVQWLWQASKRDVEKTEDRAPASTT